MTPLERAARAIAERHGWMAYNSNASSRTGPQHADEYWRNYADDARAVLTAIREPSEAMVDAASEGGFWFDDRVERNWQAMIDAILEEG